MSTSCRPENDTEDKNADDDEYHSDVDPYDSEGFVDEADRQEIEQMNPIEREKIMLEREEEKNRIRQMNRMRREQWESQRRSRGLSVTPRGSASSKKSESSRRKAALGALAARHQQKKPVPKRRRDVDADIYDDEDDRDEDDEYDRDDEDDGDFGRRPRSGKDPKRSGASSVRDSVVRDSLRSPPPVMVREPLAQFDDVKRCHVTRDKLVQWVGEPFFKKAIIGCYVRVPVGEDPKNPKVLCYRLAQLTDTQDAPKLYTCAGSPKQISVKVVATIGQSGRSFLISEISNHPIEAEEFKAYMHFMKRTSISLPTRREIDQIANQIQEADNYRYSAAEVQQMIASSGFKGVNRQRRRMDLMQERIACEDAGEKEKLANVDAQLAELDREEEQENQLQAGTKRRPVDLDTPKPKPSLFTEVAALTAGNPFDPKGPKAKTEGAANPFARRRTLQDKGWAQALSKAASIKPAPSTESLEPEKPGSQESRVASLPAAPTSVWDIDIDDAPAIPSVTPFSAPTPPTNANGRPSQVPSKTLSLADYLSGKK